MFKTKKLLTAGALTAAAALVLAGCADGGSSNGGGDAGGEATGDPIKIMAFGSLSQPPFALTQIQVGAEAAVEHVNANGGVQGRPLELVVCDDQMSPNGATACGREAVSENVAAVVGQFTLFGDAIMPQLEAAEIPLIQGVVMSEMDTQSEWSFSVLDAGTPSGVGVYFLKEQGCESVIMAAPDNNNAYFGWDMFLSPVLNNLGMTGEMITYPLNETNFTGVAQQIAGKTDCVIYGGGATDSAAMITAMSQIKPDMIQMALSTISFPESTLSQLGDAAGNIVVPSTFFYPTTGEEAALTAEKEMQAIDPNVVVDDAALNAYSAVLTFAQAAELVDGEITGASVAAALNDPATVIDTGIFAPLTFSETLGFFPPVPRAAGSTYQLYKAENGKWVPEGEPTDVAGLLGF